MKYSLRGAARGMAAAGLAALALSMVGCDGFFVCQSAACTAGSGGSANGDYVYASNSASASTSINGYTLASNTLTGTTSSPYAINTVPAAMAVSMNDGFLYVASTQNTSTLTAGIYGFSIGTGGTLSVLSSGFPQATLPSVAAMDVSADGNWLVVATQFDGVNAPTITAFPLNTSTGVFGTATPTQVPYSSTKTPTVLALKVAPSGDFISVALGTAGVMTFPFNTSTGAIGTGSPFVFTSNSVGASDLAIDSNNFLYVAATSTVYAFAIPASGIPTTTTPVSTQAIGAGGPFAVALDGTSNLYVGASTSSSTTSNLIYGFSIKSGVLTPLSTATIASPASTSKLAVDRTGSYLLAIGYDSSAGLKSYSIASNGNLSSLDTAPTGTSGTVPAVLAVTH